MTMNVGTFDRIARGVIGLVLLYLAFFSGLSLFDGVVAKYAGAIIGVVMLVVSVTRICPLYTVLGIKTCQG